jgi:uncharacterized FAD-dependent dehydrogenase
LINHIQYREFSEHPKLGSANYKLVHHDDKSGVGVYSFCMCPGGYVLSSGTEKDGLVCCILYLTIWAMMRPEEFASR